jgi:hypothetical protein
VSGSAQEDPLLALESADPEPFVVTARARLWLAPALQRGQDPLAWREEGELLLAAHAKEEEFATAGRGRTRLVALGGHEGVWRVNRHGGLLGGLRGDRYASPARLQDEVTLAGHLRALGVPTPPVLLALAARRGVAWRQHLVTLRVPEAVTVFAAREDTAAAAAARALLDRCWELGLWAADLHPDNLLWQAATGRCWLIDLAGARLLGRPLTARERAARDARFLRYFRKHADAVPAAYHEWPGARSG